MLTACTVATYGQAIEAKEVIRNLLVDGKAGANAINPSPYASRSALNIFLLLISSIGTESMSDPVMSEVLRIERQFMNVTGSVSKQSNSSPFYRSFPAGS
ncbi:hypothetical protein BD311DRAFT_808267 [Dichomitus squalens]|uniref:Uncharacterized protein n=1 Tax=Dichomitus squalens TaxID=114155 RepID=A0A4Q9MKQ9_9APHY|nr:hypothetical protein BD311DRAFT_808267 [Dichomitus squalens]